jgi:hypothetical protein
MSDNIIDLILLLIVNDFWAQGLLGGPDVFWSRNVPLQMLDILKRLDPSQARWNLDQDGIGSSNLEDLEWPQPSWCQLLTWKLEVIVLCVQEHQVSNLKGHWLQGAGPFVR